MANRFYCTPIKKCLPAAESAKQKIFEGRAHLNIGFYDDTVKINSETRFCPPSRNLTRS